MAEVTPESLLIAMWEKQEAFAPALDQLWQTHMSPVLGKVEKARSGFTDLTRAIQKRALRFGDTKPFVAMSDRYIRETYILGALFMTARDEQVRELSKLPPVEGTFRVSKAAKETALVAGYSLSLADQQAIDSLSAVHKMWFTDKTGAVYNGASFTNAAKQLIEEGRSGIEISEKLKKTVEGHFGIGAAAGKGLNYWAGVAEHAATTAGIAGQLNTMKGLGWSRYTVVNPMDERTTKVCQSMNGKTLLVDHGIANLQATLEANTPEEVRAAKPFVSGGEATALENAIGSKLTPGDRDLTEKQSKAMSAAGFAMPPYHFRCRSYIDIAFDAGSIEPGPEAADFLPPDRPPEGAFPFRLDEMKLSDVKLGGNNPKFVLEAPDGSLWMYKDYTRLHSEFRVEIDVLAARVQRAAGVRVPDTFELTIPKSWESWRASGTGAPHKSRGSIARLFNADEISLEDLTGIGLEDLAAGSRLEVQIDHAVNWVISNGDGHYENFIGLKGDRIVGIDKAQGFKFFGRDKLKINYVSPQAPQPSSGGFAYVEDQLQRYAKGDLGKLKLQSPHTAGGKLTEFGKRLQAISDIPDAEYRAIIRPYVQSAEKSRGTFSGPFGRGSLYELSSVDEVLDAIIARKNGLVDDFAKLYADIETQRATKIVSVDPSLPAHNLFRRGLSGHIEKSKLAGFQVFHAGADLENLGMLGFRLGRPGSTGARAAQIQFRGRFTPGGAAKLKKRANANLTGTSPTSLGSPSAASAVTNATKVDGFWLSYEKDDVLTFVKSFNAHMDEAAAHSVFDGVVPAKTEQLFNMLVSKFDDIVGASKGADKSAAIARLGFVPTELEVAAAKHYRAALKPFKGANGTWNTNNVLSNGKKVERYDSDSFKPSKPKPKIKPKPDEKTFAVRRASDTEAVTDHNRITGEGPTMNSEWGSGQLSKYGSVYDDSNGTIAHSFNGSTHNGYVFTSRKNKAIELRFWADSKGNAKSVYDREFRLVIDKAKPTAKDYKDAMKFLQDLGLDVKETGPALDEFKVLWARKQAESSGLSVHRDTRALFDVPADIPVKDQLRQLKEAFDAAASRTGAEHLSWNALNSGLKSEDYLPFFDEKSLVGRTRAKAKKDAFGLPGWHRADLDDKALKDAGVYGAYSSVTGETGNKKHLKLLKIMFDNDNAALIPTNQRSRMGIKIGGMSPVDDMKSGGADHIFTRVRTANTHGGIYGDYKLDGDALQAKIKRKKFDPATGHVGKAEGVYYKRDVILTQDALSYSSDKFGRKFAHSSTGVEDDKDFISTWMHHAHQSSSKDESARRLASHMLANNNEHIIGGTLSVSENVEFWIVGSHTERANAIEYLKSKSVTKFGSRKVEDVFVVK